MEIFHVNPLSIQKSSIHLRHEIFKYETYFITNYKPKT